MFLLFSLFITATAIPMCARISKLGCQIIAINLACSKVPTCISTPNKCNVVPKVLISANGIETYWDKGHDISSSKFPNVNVGEKDLNKLPISGQ